MGDGVDLHPTKYGWRLIDGQLEPIATLLPVAVAPSSLLKLSKCSCKTGCTSSRCSCVKRIAQCSGYCGCDASKCENSYISEEQENIESRGDTISDFSTKIYICLILIEPGGLSYIIKFNLIVFHIPTNIPI